MKEKVRVIGNKVRLLETIKIVEIPALEDVLHKIWKDALEKDYKRMSKDDLMKKYDLTPDDLDLLELLMDEDKIKELKKLLKDGRPIYIS